MRNSRSSQIDELFNGALSGRMSRRDVLRRAVALGLATPVIGALLAACGGDDDDDETPTTEAGAAEETVTTGEGAAEETVTSGEGGAEETVTSGEGGAEETMTGFTDEFAGTTIRWSTSLAESERQVFDDTILPDFEELTGISVEFLQIEAADFVRQLDAQVQADAVEIDVFAIDNNSLAPLVAGELIESLDQYSDMIPTETIPALLPVLTFDDTLYFLPYRPNVQITYYNSTAFDAAGLEVPRTWEDLMSVSEQFAEDEGLGKVALKGSPEGGAGPVGVTVTEFMWQAGGDPLELNSPEGIEAFTFLQNIYPSLNPQSATAKFDTMNTYLANDSVYLGPNWPFGVNVIVEEAGREDILSYSGWAGPAGEFHVLGGEVLGIPKGSPNVDAALVFAQYLMSKEVQEMLTRDLAWPSVRTDAYGAVEEWQQPYFESILASMETAQARPNVVYWGQVQQIMADAWKEIVEDGADVEETLNTYQERIVEEQEAAES